MIKNDKSFSLSEMRAVARKILHMEPCKFLVRTKNKKYRLRDVSSYMNMYTLFDFYYAKVVPCGF